MQSLSDPIGVKDFSKDFSLHSSSTFSILEQFDAEIARISEVNAKALLDCASKHNTLILAMTAESEKLKKRAEEAETYNLRIEKSCSNLMAAMKESGQKHDALLDLIESKSILIADVQKQCYEKDKALQEIAISMSTKENSYKIEIQTLTKTFEKKAIDAKAANASIADKALLSLTNELSEVRAARDREALEYSVVNRKYTSLMALINAEREKKAAAAAVSLAMTAAVGGKAVSFALGSSSTPTVTKRLAQPSSEIFRPGEIFDDEDVASPPSKVAPLKKLKRSG
jgi:hypothetical protein